MIAAPARARRLRIRAGWTLLRELQAWPILAGMVWGGTTFDAINRLRREVQSMASKRSSVRPYELGGSQAKESFDCLFLCDACGYLSETDPPCPCCGSRAWIDLDYWALAEALRSREQEMRRNPPDAVQWQVRLTSLASGAALGATGATWLALAGLVSFGWPALVGCGALATGLTHVLARRRLGWSIMSKRVQSPTRWRLPLPLVDPRARTASKISGPIEPREPLLRAPFSGRPCVGYDIAVLFDTPDDAWPPIWVLHEMRSCAFEIQGRAVARDAASLALPISKLASPTIDEEAKRKFLRERGLFLVDGSFDLHEAILEPGRSYELLWPSLPEGAPPFVRAAESAARRDPYR